MATTSTWISIGCTTLAVGLFVDNLRLRAELGENQLQSTTAAQKQMVETKRSSKRMRKSARSVPMAGTNLEAAASPDVDIEAQIEEEVEARLDDAVNEKLDQDLDQLVEARVEQRMEQQHDKRKERFRAMMEEHVAEYVEEHGHSDKTEAQLIALMEESMSSMGDVFRSMHEGQIERETAWEEIGEIREDMGLALTEVLGAEEAEAFQEDMRGPLSSRRGPPRGR